jgi:predicted transcriptional regulator
MLPGPLVKAAGVAAQLAFVCAGRFVTPVTVIVQLAVPAPIATDVNAIESGAPCVTTLAPEHPAPNVTVGVAEVNRRLAGRLSVKAIPDWAGFEPLLASVNTSVVEAVSAIEAAPNAFVSVGCAGSTTRQLGVAPLATLASALMLPGPLVKAAGFAAQLAFVCAGRFVTPATVIVQLAVPAPIATDENAIESGAPCVTTLAPEHPAPNVTVGVADVNLKFAGRLSVKAIPDCAGFVPVFASVKTSVVDPVSAIEAAPNAFVSVACEALTTRHWSVEALAAFVAVTEAERFVNAAGFVAQLALVCVATFVSPATVTVHEAVPALMAMPVSPESTFVPPL